MKTHFGSHHFIVISLKVILALFCFQLVWIESITFWVQLVLLDKRFQCSFQISLNQLINWPGSGQTIEETSFSKNVSPKFFKPPHSHLISLYWGLQCPWTINPANSILVSNKQSYNSKIFKNSLYGLRCLQTILWKHQECFLPTVVPL